MARKKGVQFVGSGPFDIVYFRDKKGRFISKEKRARIKSNLWVGGQLVGYKKWSGRVLYTQTPRVREAIQRRYKAPVEGRLGEWKTLDYRKRKRNVVIEKIVSKLKIPLFSRSHIEFDVIIGWIDPKSGRQKTKRRNFTFLCVPQGQRWQLIRCIASALVEAFQIPQTTFKKTHAIDEHGNDKVRYEVVSVNYTIKWLRYRIID